MAGLFSQLYWPKLLKYLPRLLLHTFNDKYISVCVCVFSLGFHCCLPGTFQPQSSLASFRHKRKIILKTGLLRYEQTLPCVLFSPVFIIAAKAAETEAENHVGSQARGGGVQKFTAQWHPLCRWSSHFPREFHAFRLYCIGFHAWNSLVLRDNIMDAIRCKEWLIFRTGSLVGYNETARSRRLKPSPSALTLTCLQLYYLCARWLSGGFFTKWHGSPCSFMAQGSPYPRIPFQVTAGRWMEPGTWGCIVLLLLLFVCVHLFFFSPDVGTFPQGLGEIVLTTQWSVLLEPSVITKPEFTPVRHIVTITSLAHSSLSLTRKNKPPKLGWN